MFDNGPHREFVLRRVERKGFNELGGHDLFLAIAETFFSDFSPGARDDIRLALYDCCENIVDSILAARLIKNDLTSILCELAYVTTVRRPKRGPLPSRMISAPTLSMIAGHLPSDLKPRFVEKSLYREFGRVFAVTHSQNMIEREAFVTSPQSEVISGALHFYSASDTIVGFGSAPKTHWPAALTALGLNSSRDIDGGVSIRRILNLPRRELKEIRTLCAWASKQLKLTFGVERTHDAVRINAASFFFRPPMAGLLGCLCEIIGPFPAVACADQYRVIYVARALEGWPDLYSLLYEYLDRRIGCEIEERISDAVKQRIRGEIDRYVRRAAIYAMKSSGVLNNQEADRDECARFIVRYIARHRQIALLHAARMRISNALQNVEVTSKAKKIVTDTSGCAVNWEDYHNLGRWTDVLRGRLELGLVDSGRREKLRYRIPRQVHWQWPRDAAMTKPIERLIGALVRSARQARKNAPRRGNGARNSNRRGKTAT